jgi:nucleoside-diphosphate-sugar epimerase
MNDLIEIIMDDARKIVQVLPFADLRKKKILITGASGIIGINLLACLKELSTTCSSEFSVVAVIQSEPLPYMKNLCDYSQCSILQGDLSDVSFCETLPPADLIIHAAGYGQPGRFMQNPVKTLKLNTSTTLLLFEKLLPGGKFLFISTSELYSGLSHPPFTEQQIGTTNTTHPRACYIEGKRCGEAIVNAFRGQGVNAKSARLALAYGPGTKPNDMRVLNSFIQKALNGKIALLDNGNARRTYCYVSDAVEILWNVLLSGKDPIYNVGGNSRTTIRSLAEKIGSYLHVPIEIPQKSSTFTDAPEDVFLDMSKVKNEFEKTDYISFDKGIAKTIEWQKILYQSIK